MSPTPPPPPIHRSTNTSVPLFDGACLKPGTHVNAVGSYTPTMHELDETTMKRAVVVIDTGKYAWARRKMLVSRCTGPACPTSVNGSAAPPSSPTRREGRGLRRHCDAPRCGGHHQARSRAGHLGGLAVRCAGHDAREPRAGHHPLQERWGGISGEFALLTRQQFLGLPSGCFCCVHCMSFARA